MRVTEVAKHQTVKQNLNNTSEELQNLLNGVSSGKAFTKPSDDPVGMAMTQKHRTAINHSKSLEKNIGADKVWLNSMESVIAQVSEMLKHVKELAVEGGNGTATTEFRTSMADEISMITKDLVDLGNKKEGRLFLFSGTKTFTEPLKMRGRVKEAETFLNDTRTKSDTQIIPLVQNLPVLSMGILPGFFTIQVDDYDPLTTPVDITVELTGLETMSGVVDKINEKAIEQMNYEKSDYFPTGYDALVYAEFGPDNHLYLAPKTNHEIKIIPDDQQSNEALKDSTGFLDFMEFTTMKTAILDENGNEIPLEEAISRGIELPKGPTPIENDEFQAVFEGYSKDKYLVRIIRGGEYGEARYIVSDDDGQTWSQPQVLQKNNEILNPDGKASNKVMLNFNVPGKPLFSPGLEFKYDGNEFVKYQGNQQIKNVLLDNGIKVALNITANDLFFKNDKDINSINTFEVLNRFIESLVADDQTAILKSIQDIDHAINQVLYRRGQVGSIFKELESSEERIEQNIDFKSDELSNIEDMDLAKGATDLNQAELKHQVALDSTARLIQPTLINFLK
jgi:flagellin-like hook-associated protein FlgL